MLDWVLIAAGVLASFFCSGSETGFYCINRLRLLIHAEGENPAALALQKLTRKPQLAISTILIGNNIANYLVTVLFTDQLRRAGVQLRADLYASLILPPVLLILAELTPKALFQTHADSLMYRAVWPLRAMEFIFYPFSVLLRAIGRIPQLLLGKGRSVRRPGLTRDSFQFYLSEGAAEGALTSFQRSMAENILRLRSLRVDSTMTALTDVVMISIEASFEELSRVLREHRYSRIPVYDGDRDNIVGMLNVLDVASRAEEQPSARELTREAMSIERDRTVADALSALRREQQQFAVVTNEQGRAVGIVTAKDLVEEIVGELQAW